MAIIKLSDAFSLQIIDWLVGFTNDEETNDKK